MIAAFLDGFFTVAGGALAIVCFALTGFFGLRWLYKKGVTG